MHPTIYAYRLGGPAANEAAVQEISAPGSDGKPVTERPDHIDVQPAQVYSGLLMTPQAIHGGATLSSRYHRMTQALSRRC